MICGRNLLSLSFRILVVVGRELILVVVAVGRPLLTDRSQILVGDFVKVASSLPADQHVIEKLLLALRSLAQIPLEVLVVIFMAVHERVEHSSMRDVIISAVVFIVRLGMNNVDILMLVVDRHLMMNMLEHSVGVMMMLNFHGNVDNDSLKVLRRTRRSHHSDDNQQR